MRKIIIAVYYLVLFIVILTEDSVAQHKLASLISIHVKQARLSSVLDTIGKKNGFYFSYSNEQIPSDSLVNLSVNNQTLQTVLDTLFKGNVDYKESPGYVILRLAPNVLVMDAETLDGKEQSYVISGYVLDEHSGAGISNASVYEKRLLVSTLTDKKGFFRIKVRGTGMITLTVSKEFYKDANVNFLNAVTISLKPENAKYSADNVPSKAEKSWLGRLFISSGQKIQTVNLAGYFATVPFQTSFTPGLGSHGMMSGQVVNHISINALGGYTAGLEGIELGGLFNISKQNVRYLQAAGLFNLVGGNFSGVQIAGMGNSVLKKVDGLQAAGIYNVVKDSAEGTQIAGLLNINQGNTAGLQLSGLLNHNKIDSKGVRIAGIANLTGNKVTGAQIAGVFNKVRVMNGFSLGLVNLADTLDGYAVGLINLSRNGYHKITVYSNEIAPVNLGFKTGNHKLYSLLSAGANPIDKDTFFTVGMGLGHDFVFNCHTTLSAEVSSLMLISQQWEDTHMIGRVSTLMNVNINPTFGLFMGPSFNLYYNQGSHLKNERDLIVKHKFGLMNISNSKGWFGWTIGLSFL